MCLIICLLICSIICFIICYNYFFINLKGSLGNSFDNDVNVVGNLGIVQGEKHLNAEERNIFNADRFIVRTQKLSFENRFSYYASKVSTSRLHTQRPVTGTGATTNQLTQKKQKQFESEVSAFSDERIRGLCYSDVQGGILLMDGRSLSVEGTEKCRTLVNVQIYVLYICTVYTIYL